MRKIILLYMTISIIVNSSTLPVGANLLYLEPGDAIPPLTPPPSLILLSKALLLAIDTLGPDEELSPVTTDLLRSEEGEETPHEVVITPESEAVTEPMEVDETIKPPEPDIRTVTLSFAGDCTIGDDDKYTWNTFDSVYKKVQDPGYFFQGVQSVFASDDFTFINFEGTFTDATKKAVKEYRFKGDPSYVNVLKEGSIEAVTLANNHSLDYLEQGFNDTVATLNEAGIPYTYFESSFISQINGLRVGFLGYKGWEHERRSNTLLKEQVRAMREQGVTFIVANYHWGDQNSYVPNALQKRMAHYAIDNGVDLVIGHHPHVLQGMEIYRGKPILYSLGNFCFGGAPNPKDKDTIIYQIVIHYDAVNRKILKSENVIIPVRVSGENGRNNYQPVLATGEDEKRIMEKFEWISKQIK